MPVRFARILFLRSPGASARVRAEVLQSNQEFVEGRISLYDEAGEPCVLVDGFRAISVSGVRRSGAAGGTRDVLYHVDWERTSTTFQSSQPPGCHLNNYKRSQRQHWNKSSRSEVARIAGRDGRR
jgi:hypothetical protein